MKIKFNVEDVNVMVNGEELKIGKVNYEVEGLDLKEYVMVMKEIPGIVREIKSSLEDTDVSTVSEDSDESVYKIQF